MVMIYAGGHLSGGHYNPAVTLAALIRHRIGLRDAVAYWLSQIGAGLIAAAGAHGHRSDANRRHGDNDLNGPTLLAAFVVEVAVHLRALLRRTERGDQ
jgi:aquaporin Z